MLNVQQISGGYSNADILHKLSFSVEKGELFGILGPNGSGKTTLLKMLSGLLSPSEGEIRLQNRPLGQFSPKELAKKLAVLPQIQSTAFSYTVKETISLGRHAHQKGLFPVKRDEDERIIEESMHTTGVERLKHAHLHTLSGGEKQRVFLAQALAQDPEILLLDEPINHLDLAFQKELLDQLKQWVREKGLTVIASFHDLNIASLYCDRLLLLDKGKIHTIGTVREVVQQDSIQTVYQTKVEVQDHPKGPQPQISLLPLIGESKETIINEKNICVKESETFIKTDKHLKVIHSDGQIGWQDYFKLRTSAMIEYGTFQKAFILTEKDPLESEFHHHLFFNGCLTNQGFLQAVIALTEIKTLLLGKNSGNFTIASTQMGETIPVNDLSMAIHQGIKTQINLLRQHHD